MDTARFNQLLGHRCHLAWQAGSRTARSSCSGVANLLFPPACSFCSEELAGISLGDQLLCSRCRTTFSGEPRHACPRCASPLPSHWGSHDKCPRCHGRNDRFDSAVALGDYAGAVRQAVLNMKRPEFEPLMRSLGALLGEAVRQQQPDQSADLVVPVPMHWWRRLRRGTNTARILATFTGRMLDLPVVPNLLYCRRKTRKQGTLLPHERLQNVRGAFCVSSGYDITDEKILLVDDIMTTGATVNESARVLRRAGARSVAVAVVARGIGQ